VTARVNNVRGQSLQTVPDGPTDPATNVLYALLTHFSVPKIATLMHGFDAKLANRPF